MVTRRQALKLGIGTLSGIGMLRAGQALGQSNPIDFNRDFSVSGEASLQQRATAKGLIYGTGLGYAELSVDPELEQHTVNESGLLAVDGALKWYQPPSPLRPAADAFDFTGGDWMANLARSHNLLLRGHTLIWHSALPPWFAETVNADNAEGFLVNHIQTVAGHYAGQMHSWDVVNEAIELGDGRSDGLRNSPWLEMLGPDYIDLAFRTAAEADPQALLTYNDYGLEYDDEAKQTAVLVMLEQLRARGVPIHALGLQAHLNAMPLVADRLRAFLNNVANLGLKIMITELDVEDREFPADINERDRAVASVYEDFLNIVLAEPAVIAVITWGLSDRYTWLNDSPRADSLPLRPLPLDANMNRKLAWNAIARSFDNAPAR